MEMKHLPLQENPRDPRHDAVISEMEEHKVNLADSSMREYEPERVEIEVVSEQFSEERLDYKSAQHFKDDHKVIIDDYKLHMFKGTSGRGHDVKGVALEKPSGAPEIVLRYGLRIKRTTSLLKTDDHLFTQQADQIFRVGATKKKTSLFS